MFLLFMKLVENSCWLSSDSWRLHWQSSLTASQCQMSISYQFICDTNHGQNLTKILSFLGKKNNNMGQ